MRDRTHHTAGGCQENPSTKDAFSPTSPVSLCGVLFVSSSAGPGRTGSNREQQGGEPTALRSGNLHSHEPGSIDTFSSRESVCLLFQELQKVVRKTNYFPSAKTTYRLFP